MAKIIINRDKCKGCLLCISFCPKGAIGQDGHLNKKGIRPAKFSSKAGSECLGCALCAVICPDCCIEIIK